MRKPHNASQAWQDQRESISSIGFIPRVTRRRHGHVLPPGYDLIRPSIWSGRDDRCHQRQCVRAAFLLRLAEATGRHPLHLQCTSDLVRCWLGVVTTSFETYWDDRRRYIELHSLQRSIPTLTWTLHAASAVWPIEIVRAAYISDGRKCQFHLPLAELFGPSWRWHSNNQQIDDANVASGS
jgi:hypothetical protein